MPTRRRLSSLRSFGGDCGQRRHRASDAQLPEGTWMWAWRMCMRCEYGEDSADTSDDDVPTSTGSCACSRGCDGYASTPDSGFVQRSVLRSVCTESVFLPLPSFVCWREQRSCCAQEPAKSRKVQIQKSGLEIDAASSCRRDALGLIGERVRTQLWFAPCVSLFATCSRCGRHEGRLRFFREAPGHRRNGKSE